MIPNRFISYLNVNRATIVSRQSLAFYFFRFQIRISYKFRDAVGYLMDNVEFGYLVSNGEEKGSRGKQLCKILEETRRNRLGLKAVTGPDSAEATEITEWVRTEFTEKYGKLRSSDTGIQRRYR